MSYITINRFILTGLLLKEKKIIEDIRKKKDSEYFSSLMNKPIKRWFRKDIILKSESEVVEYLRANGDYEVEIFSCRGWEKYNRIEKLLKLCEIESSDNLVHLSSDDVDLLNFS